MKLSLTSIVSISDTEPHRIEQAYQQRQLWTPRREDWLTMATVAISSLVVALDSTILVSALPTLAISLHGSAQEAFGAGTSYLLANAVFQPLTAAISDIFGRKQLLLPSVILFFVGSVMCGSAQDFATLLSGRAVQGVGGGGIVTMAQVIFVDLVPLRQHPKYLSLVLSAWAVGTILGPLIGGTLVQNSAWRWCFWLNLPVCTVVSVMTYFFVNLPPPESIFGPTLTRVDGIGAFLFISRLTSFLISVSWGGVQFTWSSWCTIVPLIMGISGLILTVSWERYGVAEPFLTRSLFRNSSAILSYLCAMFQGIALVMALYYIPFYFTAIHDADPLTSGVNLLPALCCLLSGSAIVSALITRLGHYRIFIWIGWAIGTISAGLCLLFDQDTSKTVWVTALCIFGVGAGMALSSTNFSVQACVEIKDAGRATSMYAFMRAVGMSLGVAIGGVVFQNFTKHELQIRGLSQSSALNAERFVQKLWEATVTDSKSFEDILAAYVYGFKGAFEVLTAVCGMILIMASFIQHFDMNNIPESALSVDC